MYGFCVNNYLRKFRTMGVITVEACKSLLRTGAETGILHGKKMHRHDFNTKFQFRLSFAAYQTPSYNLPKFLVPLFTANEYTVKVVDVTKIMDNAEGHFMAFFVIENLNTNIPVVEAINIYLSYLFTSKTTTILGMSRAIFTKLWELSELNNFLTLVDSTMNKRMD